MKTILLTGGAGFIGSHLTESLLEKGYQIICIDNFDSFYPKNIKEENIKNLISHPHFQLIEADIAMLSKDILIEKLKGYPIEQIIHIAAKAGVRPSIEDPVGYYRTNVTGTLNLLEFAKETGISSFIFASSSSVYGNNPKVPWKESLPNLKQISPYASTKMAGEGLGQVYAHLYDIRFTALRFFTVYGPRQRPDLAIHKFQNLMEQGKEITLYGDGTTSRDYTFIEDIISGILAAKDFIGDEKFNIFNLGNGQIVTLLEMVEAIEEAMGKHAKKKFIGEQPGDVKQTSADISKAKELLNYQPKTSLKEGVKKFIEWKEK